MHRIILTAINPILYCKQPTTYMRKTQLISKYFGKKKLSRKRVRREGNFCKKHMISVTEVPNHVSRFLLVDPRALMFWMGQDIGLGCKISKRLGLEDCCIASGEKLNSEMLTDLLL